MMSHTTSVFQDVWANMIQVSTDKLPNDAHIVDTSCRLETSRTRRVGHKAADNATGSWT